MPSREALLARTFVEAADTLVTDFDVVDFLTTLAGRCVELFDASEAGLMLADRDGGLQVAASSSRSMNHLELFELQHDEGPCIDCYRAGKATESENLRDDLHRWPSFGAEALQAGFHSAYALPLRLRSTTIGSLNLLRTEPGALAQDDRVAAQSLADVATIGILHHRAVDDAHLLADQLQHALNSRVVIEQAKGVLAQLGDIKVDDAFSLIRRYARNHNVRLGDVCRSIVNRTLSPTQVLEPHRS
jgi:GAF domain-containing protein